MKTPDKVILIGFDDTNEESITSLAIGEVNDKRVITNIKHFYGEEAEDNFRLLKSAKNNDERKHIINELVKGVTRDE